MKVVLEQQPTVGGEKCFEAKTAKFQASLKKKKKKNMTINHAVLTHPPFLMCDSCGQVNKGAVTQTCRLVLHHTEKVKAVPFETFLLFCQVPNFRFETNKQWFLNTAFPSVVA